MSCPLLLRSRMDLGVVSGLFHPHACAILQWRSGWSWWAWLNGKPIGQSQYQPLYQENIKRLRWDALRINPRKSLVSPSIYGGFVLNLNLLWNQTWEFRICIKPLMRPDDFAVVRNQLGSVWVIDFRLGRLWSQIVNIQVSNDLDIFLDIFWMPLLKNQLLNVSPISRIYPSPSVSICHVPSRGASSCQLVK